MILSNWQTPSAQTDAQRSGADMAINRNWHQLAIALQMIMDDETASSRECGCQLCIYDHGEKVIDLCSGYTAPDQQQEVSADTLFPLFSSGKPFLASLAWKLAERGLFTYDTPVAEFWQEFRTPDKAGITIEHLLSHRAGLYLLPSGKPDLTDWQGMCSKIAAMVPRNPPGAKCHYHPLTFGWLLGHTLELAAGTPLPELLKKEVIEPLGVTGKIFFGIDDDNAKRVVPADDLLIPVKPDWCAEVMNNPAIRRCCVPSFNGIGNAEALAGLYARLRGKLVRDETFDYASGKLFREPSDPVREQEWSRFALGVILAGPANDLRMFIGHGGAAGAEGFYMPGEDIALGFVKNRLSPNHPDHPIRDRISDALGIPHRFW